MDGWANGTHPCKSKPDLLLRDNFEKQPIHQLPNINLNRRPWIINDASDNKNSAWSF